MDFRLPGSSVYGILQARILGWIAISYSRGSSQLRDQTQVSCIADTTLVLLPGESHGQRSLVGCSPWGRKESDTTERSNLGPSSR